MALLAGLLALPQPVSGQDTCVDCHEDLRDPNLHQTVKDLGASVHGGEIGCSDCHGGNTDTRTVRAHQSPDFRSRVQAAAMPETCGECHADRQRMEGEELPTDQLTGYRLSVHGKAFAGGNWDAASCWDCHGNHRVLPPEDPESRVHRRNVAETCAECHASEAVMKGSDLPTDQARQWERSVHGEAHEEWLAEEGPRVDVEGREQDHPPTCPDCHGEHEMAPPEEAVEACTGCHDEAWEAFRASPHREAFERKGFLPCVECHGSHEVRAVDVTLIGVERQASCRRCHRRGQEMADTIQELARRQEKAEAKARKARQSLEDAAPGPRSDEALESLENETRELRIAIHSLDEQRIVQATEELQRTASKILERAPEETEKDTSEWRARAVVLGATLVAAIGLIGLALWSRRKS